MLARLKQSMHARKKLQHEIKRQRARKRLQQREKFQFEPLESRFLLSADALLPPIAEFDEEKTIAEQAVVVELDASSQLDQATAADEVVHSDIESGDIEVDLTLEVPIADEVIAGETTGIPAADVTAPVEERTSPVELISGQAIYQINQLSGSQLVVIDPTVPDYESLLEAWGERQLEIIDWSQLRGDTPPVIAPTAPAAVSEDEGSQLQLLPALESEEPVVVAERAEDSDEVLVTVVVLDASRDGIDQISEILEEYRDYAGIHILAHGAAASMRLGSTTLNSSNLEKYRNQLEGWGPSMKAGADLLLYGCSVASGELGVAFVEDISRYTGLDVAASNDATGGTAAGGDWVLEVSTGVIDATMLFGGSAMAEYEGILAQVENSQRSEMSDGLQALADWGAAIATFGDLDLQLPVLGQSLGDLMNLSVQLQALQAETAKQFDADATQDENDTQQLATALNGLDGIEVTDLSSAGRIVMQAVMTGESAISSNLMLDAAALGADAALADLGFVDDPLNPLTGELYSRYTFDFLFGLDDDEFFLEAPNLLITANLQVSNLNIEINAATLGSSLEIENGELALAASATIGLKSANATLGADDLATSAIADNFEIETRATFDATLPINGTFVDFPVDQLGTPSLSIMSENLFAAAGEQLSTPRVVLDFQLNEQLVSGILDTLQQIDEAIDQGLGNPALTTSLPLINQSIQQLLGIPAGVISLYDTAQPYLTDELQWEAELPTLRGMLDVINVDLLKALRGFADLTNADLFDIGLFDQSGSGYRGFDFSGWFNAQGITDFEFQLNGFDFSGADLREVDFSGFDLNGVNFSGADLRGANFSGLNLRGANFSGADLRGVDLRGALLIGADLSNAITNGKTLVNNMLYGFGTLFPKSGASDSSAQGWNGTPIELAKGIDLSGFTGLDFSGFDLSGLDLSNVNFAGISLSGANLRGVDFSGADLSGVDLSGAWALGANFSGLISDSATRFSNLFFRSSGDGASTTGGLDLAALGALDFTSGLSLAGYDLRGFDLSALSDLGSLDFSGVDLSSVNFSGADLSGVLGLDRVISLRGADFSGVDFTGLILSGVDLSGVNFSGATLIDNLFGSGSDGTSLRGSNFSGVDLSGLTLSFNGFDLRGVSFNGASFNGAILSSSLFGSSNGGTKLMGVDFSGANFNGLGLDFSGFDLSGASFSGVDLTGFNFSNANLRGVDFSDVDLTAIADKFSGAFFDAVTSLSVPGFNFVEAGGSEVVIDDLLPEDAGDIPAFAFDASFKDNNLVFGIELNQSYEMLINLAGDDPDNPVNTLFSIDTPAGLFESNISSGIAGVQGLFQLDLDVGLDLNDAIATATKLAFPAISQDDLYFTLNNLSAGVSVGLSGLDADISLASLSGALAGGYARFQGMGSVAMQDPDSDGRLTLTELSATPMAQLLTVGAAGALDAGFSVDASLNELSGLGDAGNLSSFGTPVVALSASNIFDSSSFTTVVGIVLGDKLQQALNDAAAKWGEVVTAIANNPVVDTQLPLLERTLETVLVEGIAADGISDLTQLLELESVFADYFASTTAPSLNGLQQYLSGSLLSRFNFGGGATAGPVTVQFGLDSESRQLRLDFGLNLTPSLSAEVDLAALSGALDDLGLALDAAFNLDVDGAIRSDFSLIIDLNDFIDALDLTDGNDSDATIGSDDIFITFEKPLTISVEVLADDVMLGVSGFEIENGELDLWVEAVIEVNDPNGDGRLTQAEIDSVVMSDMLNVTVDSRLDSALPFNVSLDQLLGINGDLSAFASPVLMLQGDDLIDYDSESGVTTTTPQLTLDIALSEPLVNKILSILKEIDSAIQEGLNNEALTTELPLIGDDIQGLLGLPESAGISLYDIAEPYLTARYSATAPDDLPLPTLRGLLDTINVGFTKVLRGFTDLTNAALFDIDLFDQSGSDWRGFDFAGWFTAQGVADFEFMLRGFDFSGADLRDIDFSGFDLSGVNFSGADLRGANFAGLNLRGVDFSGADLRGVDLRGAWLVGADLSDALVNRATQVGNMLFGFGTTLPQGGSDATQQGWSGTAIQLRPGLDLTGLSDVLDFSGFDLSRLDLSSVNFAGISLSGANLRGVDFSGADLSGVDLSGAWALGANFSGLISDSATRFSNLFFRSSGDGASTTGGLDLAALGALDFTSGLSLAGYDLRGFDLSALSDLGSLDFRGLDLSGVSFSGTNLTTLTGLTDSYLRGVDFSGVNFNGVGFNFSGLNLAGAKFSGATLINGLFGSGDSGNGINLRAVDLSGIDFAGLEFDFSRFDLSGATFANALNISELSFGSNRSGNSSGSILTGVNFSGVDLRGFDFSGFDFSGTNFSGASLADVNFSDAILNGVDFSGVDLSVVVSLAGSFYDAATSLSLPEFNFGDVGAGSEVVLEPLDWLTDEPGVLFSGGFEDNVLKFSLDINQAFNESVAFNLSAADLLDTTGDSGFDLTATGNALIQGGFAFGFEAGLDLNNAIGELESRASAGVGGDFNAIINGDDFLREDDLYFTLDPLQAGFYASVSDLDVALALGIGEVSVSNSDFAIEAVATIEVADPGVDDGRITLGELSDYRNGGGTVTELVSVGLESGMAGNFVMDARASLFGETVNLDQLGRFIATVTDNDLLDGELPGFAFDVELAAELQTIILDFLRSVSDFSDGVIDDINAIDLPLIDGGFGELLAMVVGDVKNPLDFYSPVNDYFAQFSSGDSTANNNAGGSAPTIRGLLEVIMATVSGGAGNALGFVIEGSTIEFALELDRRVEFSEALALNLDQFAGDAAGLFDIFNIESSGNVAITPAATFGLGFGIDFGSTTPSLYIDPEAGLEQAEIDAGIRNDGLRMSLELLADDLDLEASLDLDAMLTDLANALGITDTSFLKNLTPGMFIENGVASLDTGIALVLQEKSNSNSDGKITLSELELAPVEITGEGIDIALPLFFPTPATALGGEGHHQLTLSADITTSGLASFDVNAPAIDSTVFLRTLWENPELIVEALDMVLRNINDSINDQVMAIKLPLIGDLSSMAGFIDDIRTSVLAPLQAELEKDGGDRSVGEIIADALGAAFGLLGLDGLEVTTEENFEDDNRYVVFNIAISDKLISQSLALDFDVGMPGLGLDIDGDINLDFGYNFGFGFGFDFAAADFFIDTTGNELELFLDAYLDKNAAGENFSANGSLTFLEVEVADVDDWDADWQERWRSEEGVDKPSGLYGGFIVDLKDTGNGVGGVVNDRLTTAEMRASSFSEMLEANLEVEADVDLFAEVRVPGIDLGALGFGDVMLELPAISTTLRYSQIFSGSDFGASGSSTELGGTPEFTFEAVTVDAGEFISEFVAPILDPIITIIEPIKPLLDMLSQEIGFLKQLDSPFTSLRDMVALILGEQAVAPIDALTSLSDIIDLATGFADSGVIDFGNFDIAVDSSGNATPAQSTATSPGSSSPESNASTKARIDDFASNGSFELSLIQDPFNAVKLLLGQTADIFRYTLPALDIEMDFGRSIPVFPGLNARIGGQVDLVSDFTFGFDTRGFNAFRNDDWQDPLLLFNGFYMDDNVINGVDNPELMLGATLSAGASLGIGGLVEAGVEGGIRGDVDFDFNDDIQDGKFYADEMLKRIGQGVECLFDIEGAVSAFLDAFIWAGVDLGLFGEVTLYEYRKSFVNEVLANFTFHCPEPATPDIAAFDSTTGALALRYDGASAGDAQNYTIEYVEGPLDLGSLYDYAASSTEKSDRSDTDKVLWKDKNGRNLTSDGSVNGTPLSNQIVIKSRGVIEVYDAASITSITAVGTDGADSYKIRGDVIEYSSITTINIDARGGDDTINLGGNNEGTGGQLTSSVLNGGAGNDVIRGSDAADTILGGSGNDEIFGQGGDDLLYAVNQSVTLNNETNDPLARNYDRLVGGAGADRLYGGDGADQLIGDFDEALPANELMSGNDTLYGGRGNDYLFGGAGLDELFGEDGKDLLSGGSGDDLLEGGGQDDLLEGNAGDDMMRGGEGNDYFAGGVGDDILYGDLGADIFEWYLGEGSDAIFGVSDGLSNVGDSPDRVRLFSFTRDDAGNLNDAVADDVIRVSANGTDVALDWNGNLFNFNSIGNLDIDSGRGADTFVFEDLSATTLMNVNLAVGSEQRFVEQERQARDSNGVLAFDSDGNPVMDTFNTLQKTTDVEQDSIEIIGKLGADQFDISSITKSDPETGLNVDAVRVTQASGVTFEIREVSDQNDIITVDGAAGDDEIDASGLVKDLIGELRLIGNEGDDRLIGSMFSETIIGGAGSDRITGGLGEDLFVSDQYSDIAREYRNGKLIIDTLVEQRDADFDLSNSEVTIGSEVESLNSVFESVEFTGGERANNFVLEDWSGNGLIDGGDGSDLYRVVLTQSAEGANYINVNDTGTDGRDVLDYWGSAEMDLIQMDTVYQQTQDPDRQFSNDRWLGYGSFGDGLLIAHFGAALAGYGKKDLDDTDALFEVGVSSLLASESFQVLNYSTVEDVTVRGGEGDDVFISDDTAASLNVYGNEGDDQFYIGSILEVEEVLVEGQEITVAIEITQGTSFEMNFYGGEGDDYFEVNHNAADINLYGDNGDDTFFIKALLTLDEDGKTVDLVGKEANVNAGKEVADETDTREVDIDSLVYVENANVNIDGGAGFDSVAVVGTVLSDTFYVWSEENAEGDIIQRIFGAGIKLNQLVNIERLMLLTGGGDDRVFINGVDLGPNADMMINLGAGSDEVRVGGDEVAFKVNYPTQNSIEFATLTGYDKGTGYLSWGRTVFDITTSELIVPFTIRTPAQSEDKTLPESKAINAIQSPLTIIGGLGEIDRLIINNQGGAQDVIISDTVLLKKQIETDDTRIVLPATAARVEVPRVDEGGNPVLDNSSVQIVDVFTDLLNQEKASDAAVKQMAADFLRNQILFQDKYIETDLVDQLQNMSGDERRQVELPVGISYAVFQDTLVEEESADTLPQQLEAFLSGSGYSADFEVTTVGSNTFYTLAKDGISNASGELISFSAVVETVTIDGVDYQNITQIKLTLDGEESLFKDSVKVLKTARSLLAEFLDGTGFSAVYEEYDVPGSTETFAQLIRIENSDGDLLEFESQNKTIVVDGVERRDMIGVSLITASKSLFEVRAGYIESVSVVDSDRLNTVAFQGVPASIFFDGFDEFNLSLNATAENTLLLDNNFFEGVTTVTGGEQRDQFTVLGSIGKSLLYGQEGDDQYSIGDGMIDSISAELFLLGGAGDDSVVVNSEALAADANVALDKNYLERQFEQVKLNKISSLLGFGGDDNVEISTTENELIVAKLKQQTEAYITLLGNAGSNNAGFEQFELVAALTGKRYAPELQALFDSAQQIFDDKVAVLVSDSESAYLASLEQMIDEYEVLTIRESTLQSVENYRLMIEALDDDRIAAQNALQSRLNDLNDSLLAEYGAAGYTDADRDAFEELLAGYAAGTTDLSGLLADGGLLDNLRQSTIDSFNVELTTLAEAYRSAVVAVDTLLATYADVGADFDTIIATLEADLTEQQTAEQGLNAQVDSLLNDRSAFDTQLSLYLENSDGSVTAASLISFVQEALNAEQAAFEATLTELAETYKNADSASRPAALAAIDVHLATLGNPLSTDARGVFDGQLAAYLADTDGSVTVDSLLNADIQAALAADKLDFENELTTQASAYKAANDVVTALVDKYGTTGVTTLRNIIDTLELERATLELASTTAEAELRERMDEIFGEPYAVATGTSFDTAMPSFIDGSMAVSLLLDTLNDAYEAQAVTYETELVPMLEAYKAEADEISRLTLWLAKDGLSLAAAESDLVDAEAETDVDSALVAHLEAVIAHKAAQMAGGARMDSVVTPAVAAARLDLNQYISEQLPSASSTAVDAAIATGDERSTDQLYQDLLAALDTELNEAFGSGISDERQNFENGVFGLVSAFKQAREAELALMEELAAYTDSSAAVTALLQSVRSAVAAIADTLSNSQGLDVDDYLAVADTTTLRDYLGGRALGDSSSTVNGLAQPVKERLSAIITAIEALSDDLFDRNEIAALDTAIEAFVDEVNAINEGVSAEGDLLKTVASGLMPALDIANIQTQLSNIQSVLDYQTDNPALFNVAAAFASDDVSFADAQALFKDSGTKSELITLIKAYRDVEKLADAYGISRFQELSPFNDTLQALERLGVYASYLPETGLLDVEGLFTSYEANLSNYAEIANAPERVDNIKIKAEAEARLASLEKDRRVVDQVVADNGEADTYRYTIFQWWGGWVNNFYETRFFQDPAQVAKINNAKAAQTELASTIAALNTDLAVANAALSDTDAVLADLDEKLAAQFLMVKVMSPVVLEVFSDTRSGSDLKALLDKDSSLIATVRSYSNEYSVVTEAGDDVVNDPVFSDANFSTVTSTVSSLDYTALLSLTGLNNAGIYADYEQIESFTLNLGDGNDTVIISDSLGQRDSRMQINSAAGDDTIRIGNELDTVDDVLGNLFIDAGEGENALTVEDSGDVTGDTITQQYADDDYLQLSGMSDGEIFYQSSGGFSKGLSITSSSGGDVITIDALHADDLTELFSVAGDDEIYVNDFDLNPAATLTIYAGDGADLVDGTAAPLALTILGENGEDTLWGSQLGDLISGGDGRDYIWGLSGNDTIWGDVIGGSLANGSDIIFGNGGDDEIYGQGGNDALFGDDGVATFDAAGYLVDIRSSGLAQGGNDLLSGGGGNDILVGGIGDDALSGGAGNDFLFGSNAFVTLNPVWMVTQGGDLETDVSSGNNSESSAIAAGISFVGSAHSTIAAPRLEQSDNDTLRGSDGDDVLMGGAGSDRLYGGGGRDDMIGDSGLVTYERELNRSTYETRNFFIGGDDYLDAGSGNDKLFGGFGRDTLVGSLSDDLLVGDNGRLIMENGFVKSLVRLGQGELSLTMSTMSALLNSNDVRIKEILGEIEQNQEMLAGRTVGINNAEKHSSENSLAGKPFQLASISTVNSAGTQIVNQLLEEHTVVYGETLTTIAEDYLGDAARWKEIQALNPEIKDPDRIPEGMTIKLPPIDAEPVDVEPALITAPPVAQLDKQPLLTHTLLGGIVPVVSGAGQNYAGLSYADAVAANEADGETEIDEVLLGVAAVTAAGLGRAQLNWRVLQSRKELMTDEVGSVNAAGFNRLKNEYEGKQYLRWDQGSLG